MKVTRRTPLHSRSVSANPALQQFLPQLLLVSLFLLLKGLYVARMSELGESQRVRQLPLDERVFGQPPSADRALQIKKRPNSEK